MSTVHKGLTVTVTLDEQKIPYVNGLLSEYRKDLRLYQEKYQKSLPGTFFISWLTLPAQIYQDKETLPARILLLTSYVGSKSQHLKELASFLAPQLRQVFSQSSEFPSQKPSEKELVRFLNQKSIPNTFYSGFKFISTSEVDKEVQLKSEVLTFMQKKQASLGPASEPTAVKKAIESHILNHPKLHWASRGIPNRTRNKIQMLWPLAVFGLLMVASIASLIALLFTDVLIFKLLAWIFPAFLLITGSLFCYYDLMKTIPINPRLSFLMKRYARLWRWKPTR